MKILQINILIMVGDLENVDRTSKRRLASEIGCSIDLKNELIIIFKAFNEAVEKYSTEIRQTPPESRARAFEASLLNSKMIQCIQNNFEGKNCKFGRYKRFILSLNGYHILFKKLDNKDLPMNISTKSVSAINNQQTLSLFDGTDFIADPILYFGYKKDKYGNIVHPKLVYIDDFKVKWTIGENDIDNKIININSELKEVIVEDILNKPMPKLRQIKENREAK